MSNKVLNYLDMISENIDVKNLKKYTVASIGLSTSMSSSEVLAQLRELNKKEQIVTVLGSPNLYFSIASLRRKHPSATISQEYASIDNFFFSFDNETKDSIFSELIGYNGSLIHTINQIIASLNYPGVGLPVLLYGESGTGKSLLASMMFRYVVQQRLVADKASYLIVNCAEYANNPELFSINLFGHVKGAFTDAHSVKEGILSLADNGVLFLDEVHCLSAQLQEKIFLFLDKGIYHMVGDNETWYKSKVRIVMATTKRPEEALLTTFLRRIPMVINVPSLDNYSFREKSEFIHHFYCIEAKAIKQKISISKLAFQSMSSYRYSGNIGELENAIKMSVANAYIRTNNSELKIRISDLPLSILNHALSTIHRRDEDNAFISLEEHRETVNYNSRFLRLNLKILKEYEESLNSQKEIQLSNIYEEYHKHIDYLFSNGVNQINVESPMLKFVESSLQILSARYFYSNVSNNEIAVLTKFIEDLNGNIEAVEYIQKMYTSKLDKIVNYEMVNNNTEYLLAQDFLSILDRNYIYRVNQVVLLDFILLFKYFRRNERDLKTKAIIISHGYNIASGMADLVNKLLNVRIFDSIDMPIEATFFEILEEFNKKVENLTNIENILILVDMGSLEEIHKYIDQHIQANVGIVSNVNTKLALDIGSSILNDKEIETSLREITNVNRSHYLYKRNLKKQNAIVCISANNNQSYESISDLIEKSLPGNSKLKIIEVDQSAINSEGLPFSITKKYNVISIISNHALVSDTIPILSLEDLVTNQNPNKIQSILKHQLTIEEITQFSQKLLRNFSLINIQRFMNIINPHKVIDDVEETIGFLEKELNDVFNSGAKLLLYIHISCLIERLIINVKDDIGEGNSEFYDENSEFIEASKRAFKKLENEYHIKIPNAEYEYLFDCINKDSYVFNCDRKENQNKVNIFDY